MECVASDTWRTTMRAILVPCMFTSVKLTCTYLLMLPCSSTCSRYFQWSMRCPLLVTVWLRWGPPLVNCHSPHEFQLRSSLYRHPPRHWVPAPYRLGVRLEPELVPAVAIVNAEATTSTAIGWMRAVIGRSSRTECRALRDRSDCALKDRVSNFEGH